MIPPYFDSFNTKHVIINSSFPRQSQLRNATLSCKVAPRWAARYLALRAFLEQSDGRYPLARRCATSGDSERSLGHWVKDQRRAHQGTGRAVAAWIA